MQDTCHVHARPPSGGFVTIGTLILAAISAVLLVLMSGCHSSPPPNGFAASTADKALEARLRPAGTMPHLKAYDESFYVAPEEDPAALP
jgi:hypothetical protein